MVGGFSVTEFEAVSKAEERRCSSSLPGYPTGHGTLGLSESAYLEKPPQCQGSGFPIPPSTQMDFSDEKDPNKAPGNNPFPERGAGRSSLPVPSAKALLNHRSEALFSRSRSSAVTE